MQPSSHRSIWDTGEDIAVRYLENKGYETIERNYQVKWGEIDIIMRDHRLTVFIEVKYRKNEDYGHPLDTFSQAKRRAMKRTIMLYINKNKIDLELVRIDFIGIMPNKLWGHRVWHVRGVEV
jgi:putative endonuclease